MSDGSISVFLKGAKNLGIFRVCREGISPAVTPRNHWDPLSGMEGGGGTPPYMPTLTNPCYH